MHAAYPLTLAPTLGFVWSLRHRFADPSLSPRVILLEYDLWMTLKFWI